MGNLSGVPFDILGQQCAATEPGLQRVKLSMLAICQHALVFPSPVSTQCFRPDSPVPSALVLAEHVA